MQTSRAVFQNPPAPLSRRPEIVQAGLGEHHGPREETFEFEDAWQLHLYFWRGEFEIDGTRFGVDPEMVSLLPPGRPITWRFTEEHCDHYFVHFRLPGKQRKALIQPTNHIQTRYELFSRLFGSVVASYRSDPFAAEVRLWTLLFQLADMQEPPALRTLPGAVETARTLMDSELSTGINASQVAARVGYSRSQLNRLFQEHAGQTLAQYLTEKRVSLARELLTNSNLAIAQVGRRIGIHEPHHFNKFIRRHLGVSPREYRRRKSPRVENRST